MKRFLLSLLACLILPGLAVGADMPVKAPTAPFSGYPYFGSGFYKGLTTFMQVDDSKISAPGLGATLFQAGAGVGFTLGYQWANAPGTTFTAIEGTCAYSNLGGNQLAGVTSIESKISCEQMVKFGGPIAMLLNWLPNGLQFPTLPNLGNATGTAHPYVGGGLRERLDQGNIVGLADHRTWHFNGFLSAGFLQQWSSNVVTDFRLEWAPAGQSFTIGTPVSAQTGQNFRVVGALFF